MQPAMRGIVGIKGPSPTLSTVQLYNEDRDELALESVYPLEQYASLAHRIGERRQVRSLASNNERVGVVGRVILGGEPQLIGDVRENPDYIEYSPATLSELAVPLLDREKVIGVLNAESDELGAFDEEDLEALRALAELVVVAIKSLEAPA